MYEAERLRRDLEWCIDEIMERMLKGEWLFDIFQSSEELPKYSDLIRWALCEPDGIKALELVHKLRRT